MTQNATDERIHNQPSQEAQRKGGERSHQNQYTKGSSPSHETQGKGGRQSDQDSQDRSDDSGEVRSHNQPSHEAQVKGGQHSHTGGSQR
jgi:hypothetical protein